MKLGYSIVGPRMLTSWRGDFLILENGLNRKGGQRKSSIEILNNEMEEPFKRREWVCRRRKHWRQRDRKLNISFSFLSLKYFFLCGESIEETRGATKVTTFLFVKRCPRERERRPNDAISSSSCHILVTGVYPK